MSVVYDTSPQTSTEPAESIHYREARADARLCSVDAVMAFRSVFKDDAADPDLGPTERFMAQERFCAFDDELNRRVRIIQMNPKAAAKLTREYEDWAELAEVVKQRVSVREVLELAGFHITDERSGEAHAPCPLCGGHDRLVIWPRKAWCRKCRWNPDAIAVAMSYLPNCTTFRDAVRFLDDYAFVRGGVG